MNATHRLGLDWRTRFHGDPDLPCMLQRFVHGRGWVDATAFASADSAADSLVTRHRWAGDAPDVRAPATFRADIEGRL